MNPIMKRDRNVSPFDLWKNVDQVFEDFFSPTFSGGKDMMKFSWNPAVDVEEEDNYYLLSFDLPGMSKDDVRIELTDNQLIVSGERKYESEKKEGKNRWFSERSYGSFQRVFTLPNAIDSDKVEADYKDGVLRIAVPKSAAAKPRQIRVGESKGGFFGKFLGTESKESKKAG